MLQRLSRKACIGELPRAHRAQTEPRLGAHEQSVTPRSGSFKLLVFRSSASQPDCRRRSPPALPRACPQKRARQARWGYPCPGSLMAIAASIPIRAPIANSKRSSAPRSVLVAHARSVRLSADKRYHERNSFTRYSAPANRARSSFERT
jgi:hypothetical protein